MEEINDGGKNLPHRIITGLTGASGALYTIEFLKLCRGQKFLIPTLQGMRVFKDETGQGVEILKPFVRNIFDDGDLFSPFSSGSNFFDALVILPCSINTLGKIASGISDTLLTRVAAVALKERRKLILCLREAPLSTIALRNALMLSEAGAVIFPLSPSFYMKPQNIDEMVRTTISRIISMLGHRLDSGFNEGEIL